MKYLTPHDVIQTEIQTYSYSPTVSVTFQHEAHVGHPHGQSSSNSTHTSWQFPPEDLLGEL